MNCNEIRPLLTQYLLGDLDSETTDAIKVHLESCPACQAELAMLEPTLQLLGDAFAKPATAQTRLSTSRRESVLRPVGTLRKTIQWVGSAHPKMSIAAGLVFVCGMLWTLLIPAMVGSRQKAGSVRVMPPKGAARDAGWLNCLSGDIQPEEAREAPASSMSFSDAKPRLSPRRGRRGSVAGLEVVEPEPLEDLDFTPDTTVPPTEVSAPPADGPNYESYFSDGTSVAAPPEDVSVQPAEFDSVAMVNSPIIMKGIYGNRNPGARAEALKRYGGGGGGPEESVGGEQDRILDEDINGGVAANVVIVNGYSNKGGFGYDDTDDDGLSNQDEYEVEVTTESGAAATFSTGGGVPILGDTPVLGRLFQSPETGEGSKDSFAKGDKRKELKQRQARLASRAGRGASSDDWYVKAEKDEKDTAQMSMSGGEKRDIIPSVPGSPIPQTDRQKPPSPDFLMAKLKWTHTKGTSDDKKSRDWNQSPNNMLGLDKPAPTKSVDKIDGGREGERSALLHEDREEAGPSVTVAMKEVQENLVNLYEMSGRNERRRDVITSKPSDDLSEGEERELSNLKIEKEALTEELTDMVEDLTRTEWDYADSGEIEITEETLRQAKDALNDMEPLVSMMSQDSDEAAENNSLTMETAGMQDKAKETESGQPDPDFGGGMEQGDAESSEDEGIASEVGELAAALPSIIKELSKALEELGEPIPESGSELDDYSAPGGSSTSDNRDSAVAAGQMTDTSPKPTSKPKHKGRGNVGRAGEASSEMVAGKMPAISDARVAMPPRMADSAAQKGQVQDEDTSVGATAIGVAKGTGQAVGFEDKGHLPPDAYDTLERIAGALKEDSKENNKGILLALNKHNLPATDLKVALDLMRQAKSSKLGVAERQLVSEALKHMSLAQDSLATAIERQQNEIAERKNNKAFNSDTSVGVVPPGYENMVSSYFKAVADADDGKRIIEEPAKPAATERVRRDALQKLKTIRIPELDFRQANIADIADFFEQSSVAFGDDDGEAALTISVAESLGKMAASSSEVVSDPFAADSDYAPDDGTRVTFAARDITLKEALDIATDVAGLKYRIGKKGQIVISPKNAPEGEIVHTMLDVPRSAMKAILQAGGKVRDRDGLIDVSDLFSEQGVDCPSSASVKYSERLGKLIAQNTPGNIKVLERVVDSLREAEAEKAARFKAFGVNPFVKVADQPFSTFAIDVDTAAYTLGRNYMKQGYLPPPESVRTEEYVNFFDYAYKAPTHKTFQVYTDMAPSKFGRGQHMLKIGVKGRRLGREEQRQASLTFLIDTSGSMNQTDRLGLVQKSLGLLVNEMNPADRVAIVQYDSHARLVLEHTPISNKAAILAAIKSLQCGGSTNLEEGMHRAYALAAANFIPKGENRVLLLSDGVANLGSGAAEDILAKVDAFRRQGITCSVFGFGMGTYDDAMLETLANKGDGSYAFIDSESEARRVFIDDLSATLNTIAADVKIQVEYSPEYVARYRQLGYENRQLKKQDFRNDAIDAGEVGSGQSVTALYELELGKRPVKPVPYAAARGRRPADDVIATVRVRYRRIDTGAVEEIEHRVHLRDVLPSFDAATPRFKLATAAAEFSEILRGSPFSKGSSTEDVAAMLRPVALALPLDKHVHELLRLVDRADGMSHGQ